METPIREGPSAIVKTGLSEFTSELAPRLKEPRASVDDQTGRGEDRFQEKDAIDSELLHRLHADMRKAVAEMRATQAATLAALSHLQMTLIAWIVFTAIAVVLLIKLL